MSSSSVNRWEAEGTFSSINLILTWGLDPVINSWGVHCVPLCFQELCTYSAIGRRGAHLFGWMEVHGQRYCSIHAFILSVCLSVLGWNAVDKFCCIPRPLQMALEKWEVKRGSLSDMIHLGSPNQGTRYRRYSRATPVPSMSFLHSMNFATLEHP